MLTNPVMWAKYSWYLQSSVWVLWAVTNILGRNHYLHSVILSHATSWQRSISS